MRSASRTQKDPLVQALGESFVGLARKELGAVFGPAWRKFDRDTRDDMVTEVYSRWLPLSRGGGLPSSEDIYAIAQVVRQERRADFEQEIAFGEKLSSIGTPPEAFQTDTEATADLRRSMTVEGRIEALLKSTNPAERLRGTLVGLHLGRSVLPGQPRVFRGRGPERDLKKHHPGAGRLCPTCRSLARFVRVPGVGPNEVGQFIDAFAIQLRQELA